MNVSEVAIEEFDEFKAELSVVMAELSSLRERNGFLEHLALIQTCGVREDDEPVPSVEPVTMVELVWFDPPPIASIEPAPLAAVPASVSKVVSNVESGKRHYFRMTKRVTDKSSLKLYLRNKEVVFFDFGSVRTKAKYDAKRDCLRVKKLKGTFGEYTRSPSTTLFRLCESRGIKSYGDGWIRGYVVRGGVTYRLIELWTHIKSDVPAKLPPTPPS